MRIRYLLFSILILGAAVCSFLLLKKPPGRQLASNTTDSIVLQISDPAVIAELDRDADSPLSLFRIFRVLHEEKEMAVPPIPRGRASAGDLLAYRETYGEIARILRSDLSRVVREIGIDWETDITKTYVREAAKTPEGRIHRGNGNVTRIFNEAWFRSRDGKFLLAGVVNRIDRKDFSPGTCGEVRFVYRLAYEVEREGRTYASRMPLTLNLVFHYPDDGSGCRTVVDAWRLPNLSAKSSEELLDLRNRLEEGPLNFSRLRFRQLEVNAQIARFPSDLENVVGRKFAGQAIYWMRIFRVQEGKFVPVPLENTPDIRAIAEDPAKKRALKDYIASHLSEIDQGTFLLPESLLTDLALSFSTMGSARVANRPFDRIFTADEATSLLASGSPGGTRWKMIRNGAALLERLNQSTCMGCHQSASTAGFHFLGVDRNDYGRSAQAISAATDGNRLELPFSPHFYAEIPRRRAYLEAISASRSPNRFRPHPAAPAAGWSASEPRYADANEGMPCPISSTGAADWGCNASRGMTCRRLVSNPSLVSESLGVCAPAKAGITAGLACRTNRIRDSRALDPSALAATLPSFRDQVEVDSQVYALPEGRVGQEYNCRPTRIGVPLGRTTKSCDADARVLKGFATGAMVPREACAVVGGKGFEQMARGYFDSVKFAEGVGRGMLDTCSSHRFCREDYICQQLPDFLTTPRFGVSRAAIERARKDGIGFCTPTYFVYQLRLDGHPNPR